MDKIKISEDRFSRLELISWWDQEKLSKAKVMVVGAGALGNEVLKNLALYGIGNICIVDFDKIEESNLTRTVLFKEKDIGRFKAEVAAERVKEIYTDTKVMWSNGDIGFDIGLGVFRRMDIIIGCIDNREARLFLNRNAWKVNKTWIDGGIQEIMGSFAVYKPSEGACYECTLSDKDYEILNVRYSCPLLRREDILMGKSPTTPSISSIIAGFQVQEAIKILHDIPVNPGVLYYINGATNLFDFIKFERKENCQSHILYEPIFEIDETSEALTFESLLKIGKEMIGTEKASINLDRDILIKFICPNCGNEEEVLKPVIRVPQDKETCPYCGAKRKYEATNIINGNESWANKTLKELGFPSFHIYEINSLDKSIFIEISGDLNNSLYFK